MKKPLIIGLIIVVLMTVGLVTMAQDDEMTTFAFESSDVSIMFPEDWEQDIDDDGVVMLSTDGVTMMVYDAVTLAVVLGVEDATSAEDVLESAIDSLPLDEIDVDASNAKAVELGDREVLRVAFNTDDSNGAITVLPLDDESFGLVMFMIDSEADEELASGVDAVVESFMIAEAEASGEACTVSTDAAGTVQIRVGPGFNRTVIAFLPAQIDFTAQGQATDDDGNVWFRIPREEAAPTKAVNETWVAADDVDQAGDCANVEGAVAPPLIPIRVAQPTAVPQPATDTTTDSTGDTPTDTTTEDAPDAPAVDASGAILPTQGNWYIVYLTGTAQCRFTSGNFDSFAPETFPLSGNASDGIFFIEYMDYLGENTYQTAYQVTTTTGVVVTVRATMTLTSANSAVGSLGYVIGSCNYNVPYNVNYIGG